MDILQPENNLRLVRIQHGFIQGQAAYFCGISKNTLAELEQTHADMTVEILKEIRDGLCISLDELTNCPRETAHFSGTVEYFALLERSNVPEYSFTYGLAVCKETFEGTYLLCIVHDISTDPNLVMAIARDFDSYGLSPVHLLDTILDRIP